MKMKYGWLTLLALFMAGCACTGATPQAARETDALAITWFAPQGAEIQLNGLRYQGTWTEQRCFTPQCRGEFRDVPKVHRSHVRRGSAELLAAGQARLNCDWVRHDDRVAGSCSAPDGRTYRLTGA